VELAIGIDLGTSTSEIACFDASRGEPRLIPDPATRMAIIPSIVAKSKKGELLVGDAALAFVDIPGRGVREIKRLMGSGETVTIEGKEYRPEEISACILDKLRDIAQEALGEEIREVVLSVPANFPDAARTATRNAAEIAGLNVIRLINEPTAAAMAYGIRNLDADERILVFDFGGGTLDISILEMVEGILDVKASYGDTRLGGKDLDDAMSELIIGKFKGEHPDAQISRKSTKLIKLVAEKAKIALTSETVHVASLPFFASEGGEIIDLEIEITREEFEEAIAPLLERTRKVLEQALKTKKIGKETINKVLLVGGTTYVPAVRKLAGDFFGKPPRTDVDPDSAVAMGACIQAAIAKDLISTETGLIVTDVCPFGLGVRTMEKVGNQVRTDCYQALIEPNTTIPFSKIERFTLIKHDQNSVRIEIYQDHLGGAKYIHQVTTTGIVGLIKDIPPSESGLPHPVDVKFTYNEDGIIVITAAIPTTGQRVAIKFSTSGLRMSDSDKSASQAKLGELLDLSPGMAYSASSAASILMRGIEMLARVPEEERNGLEMLISDLDNLLEKGDEAEIEAAADSLTDLLYDLETRYH